LLKGLDTVFIDEELKKVMAEPDFDYLVQTVGLNLLDEAFLDIRGVVAARFARILLARLLLDDALHFVKYIY